MDYLNTVVKMFFKKIKDLVEIKSVEKKMSRIKQRGIPMPERYRSGTGR